jgi:hypothetical protein
MYTALSQHTWSSEYGPNLVPRDEQLAALQQVVPIRFACPRKPATERQMHALQGEVPLNRSIRQQLEHEEGVHDVLARHHTCTPKPQPQRAQTPTQRNRTNVHERLMESNAPGATRAMSSWCATLPYALMSSSLYHPVGSRMILNSRSLMFSRASRTAAPSEGLPAAAWREREREGWCHSLEGREGGGGRRAASLTGVSTGSGTGSAAAITCGFSVGTDTEAAAGSGTSCHPAAACALPFEESGEQRGSIHTAAEK